MISGYANTLFRTAYSFSAILQAGEKEPVTVIRAGKMLDVRSGKLITNQVIVVKGDRIESVTPTQLPEKEELLDLQRLTLLPGLIDTHTHLVEASNNEQA